MSAGRADEPAPVRLAHLVEWGDTSGFFTQLARYHDRTRFDVRFLTLKPADPAFREAVGEHGVEVESLDRSSRWGYPAAVLELVRRLRAEGVQLLHTHLFDPSVVGLAAGWTARTPARIVTRHHSDYHTRLGKRAHVALDRLCTRLAHRVVAVSEHTRRVLLEEEGAPPEKVVTIPNGVDPERVRPPGPEAVASARRELGMEGRLTLLVPARLHPEKGQPHLFEAVARMPEGGPEGGPEKARPLRVLVAGAGPFLESYREQVRGLGLDGTVSFLGFRPDVTTLMAAADLVVLPSVAEAFGLVLVEAIALGTPVVASRAGGIPEVVEDGVEGLLVPPGDPEALAAALESLRADPERLRRLREGCGPGILERFDFRRMVRRYEALYEDVLARVQARG